MNPGRWHSRKAVELERSPISDELRESILLVLNKNRVVTGRDKGVLNVRAGERPGEIVYVAPEMNISCMVYEDDTFLTFEWPFGNRKQRARKRDFLSELAQKLSQ
jgi:hypothetical protein